MLFIDFTQILAGSKKIATSKYHELNTLNKRSQ